MKKVLILAYDFPPLLSIGAARPYSWYRYFHENELYPVVVTRHWDSDIKTSAGTIKSSLQTNTTTEITPQGTIIRCPYTANYRDRLLIKYGDSLIRYYRKLVSFVFTYLRYFIFRIDSASRIYVEAEKYIQNNNVACIIATTEPFFLLKYASRLSEKYNIPWIADYRDGFSSNNLLKFNNDFLTKIIQKINSVIEISTLRNAAGITAAAPSYIEDIIKKLNFRVKSEIIFNGYDEWTKIENRNVDKSVLKFAYSGRLYSHHPVEEFFNTLKEIARKYQLIKFEISFYGLEFYENDVSRIQTAAGELSNTVKIYPRLNYNDYMNAISQSDYLLLFAIPGLDWLNAKIFDYFSVSKSVILFKNDNAILYKLISENNCGITLNNKEELSIYFNKIFSGFEQKIDYEIHPDNVQNYSRKYQSEMMTKFIHQCVE